MLPVFMAMVESNHGKVLFDTIYCQYRKQMLVEAQKILQDDYLAEDAVQNALLGIARTVDDVHFPDCGGVRSYVLVAVRRAALDIREKEQKEDACAREMDLFITKTVPDKYNDIINRELLQELFAIIGKMPKDLQIVLFYAAVYEMSGVEIARLLQRPANTVNKWLRKARKMLRENCRKEGISIEM